ncbi:MAG: phosphoglucosamine mutase [Candidatus Thermoplasmatota archaeon]|nr:phosphoglucosamine mutase [Candidatus Thermoplasmatota archaeon]
MTQQSIVPRLFGTNGVRGVVNTEEMDCDFAMRLGMAIGTFMKGSVLVGTDARTSNEMLKSACMAGIMATGCDVLDCGVVPTPTVQFAVKSNDVAGGVMVTASHNPPEFNGVKCVDPDGTEMAREHEEKIEEIFHTERFSRADWRGIGRRDNFDRAVPDYIDGIVARTDVEGIRKADLRVALDCGNGAGGNVSPRLLERLGVRYVTLNADPNGAFPGHNSEPTPENAKDLVEFVKAGDFDIGILHDGDADRTIFVDENGAYMYGDRSLAIAAQYACTNRNGGLVVTTVGSSKCVEDAVKMAGGEIMYTKVGSPVVARAMIAHSAIFGGEENGGLIFPEFQYCRDGAMAAAKMIEIIAMDGALSEINAVIPAYSQYKTKTPCPNKVKDSVLAKLLEDAGSDNVDTTDGLKIFLDDGWVLVRPSGTEPIFRIFSEATTADRARDIAESYKKRVAETVT